MISLLIHHRIFGCVHQTFLQEVLIFEEFSHIETLRNLTSAPCNALGLWLCTLSLKLPAFSVYTLRLCLTYGLLFLLFVLILVFYSYL